MVEYQEPATPAKYEAFQLDSTVVMLQPPSYLWIQNPCPLQLANPHKNHEVVLPCSQDGGSREPRDLSQSWETTCLVQ